MFFLPRASSRGSDLGEVLPDQALPGPRQAEVVVEPAQRPFNERVGRLAVVGGGVGRSLPPRKARTSSRVRIRSVQSVTITLP